MATDLKPNEGKKGVIEVDGVQYLRLPIPTHLITDQDNICDVAQQYGAPLLQPGDGYPERPEPCRLRIPFATESPQPQFCKTGNQPWQQSSRVNRQSVQTGCLYFLLL